MAIRLGKSQIDLRRCYLGPQTCVSSLHGVRYGYSEDFSVKNYVKDVVSNQFWISWLV